LSDRIFKAGGLDPADRSEQVVSEGVFSCESVSGVSESESLDQVSDEVGHGEAVDGQSGFRVQLEGFPVIICLKRVLFG